MTRCPTPHTPDGKVWCGASFPPTIVTEPYAVHARKARVQIYAARLIDEDSCILEQSALPVDSELFRIQDDLSADLVTTVVAKALIAAGYQQPNQIQ